MAGYVDGFVIPIPKKNIAAYKKMAAWGKKMWMKHGALQYFECVGDDLKVPKGMGAGFPKGVKLKANETAIFAFITDRVRRTSGWSRSRRWSGIVVFTPSTTKSSRARRPRARASSRVWPWTTSFARRES